MGEDLEKRVRILMAAVRAAAGIYAFYILLPLITRLPESPSLFAVLIFFYLIVTDFLLFLEQPVFPLIVLVCDSLFCIAVVLGRNPALFPLLIVPGLLAGLSRNHFKAFVIWGNAFLQISILFLSNHSRPEASIPASYRLFAHILVMNVLSATSAYVVFQLLREREQNKGLLDLIQVGQQMGASLNYEKVSTLLMKVLTSMFDGHSYGFYVVEEREGEKMAVIRGIQSPYSQVLLDFDVNLKDSIFSQTLTEKKLRVVSDLRSLNDRILPTVRTFRAALICPILFESQALGLIFIISAAPNSYTSQQSSLMELLSHQFAVTLKNILLYQQTAVMAITDSLTGLYTHGFFQDQLVKQVTDHKYTNKPLSVIIIDVDHFKIVNDQYGHPQGDYILRQMAGVVKNAVRPKDFVCRYGGDEFVLITPGLDRISAAAYAERIRKSVEDYHFMAGGKTARITVSAGVSSFPESADTPKEIIDASDKALYEAKNRGRNRIVYL